MNECIAARLHTFSFKGWRAVNILVLWKKTSIRCDGFTALARVEDKMRVDAEDQARAHYNEIVEVVKEMEFDGSFCGESPLSLCVRSGWTTVGEPLGAEQYQILLMTGGPAVRIVGDLGHDGVPHNATMQVQDWFKPWTDFLECDPEVLLSYARCWYFCSP